MAPLLDEILILYLTTTMLAEERYTEDIATMITIPDHRTSCIKKNHFFPVETHTTPKYFESHFDVRDILWQDNIKS